MEVKSQVHFPTTFIPRKRVLGAHWTRDTVEYRAILDAAVVKREIVMFYWEQTPAHH
jgi:hypothetical protein